MCRSAEGASHEGTWQTQIDLRDRPCRIHPRCGHLSLPGAPSLLGRDPPYSSSIPPRLSPPTSTHPSVRLHRTMSLCGTHRVCVPECPPLGRPSYNKVGPYQNCQSMRQIRQIPVSPPDAAWIGDPRRSPRRPAVPKRGSDEAKGVERGWDFRIEKAGHAAFARACLPSLRRGVPVEAGMCTC